MQFLQRVPQGPCLLLAVAVALALAVAWPSAAGPRVPQSQWGPLDTFVWAPDATYNWTVVDRFALPYGKAVVLRLTSGTWLNSTMVSSPVWEHWVEICIPDDLAFPDHAFIYIDGGELPKPGANHTSIFDLVKNMCYESGMVAVHLTDVPAQPQVFWPGQPNATSSLIEDGLIAYAWRQFVEWNSTQPNWLPRLPMARAGVRAMDAVEAFLASEAGAGAAASKQWVVAGASKRAWTTWMVGATDGRVVGMAPLVLPILSTRKVFNLSWQSLGEWTFAIHDYVENGIMKIFNGPQLDRLLELLDPLSYRERYTDVQLYMIDACGDEFTPPDAPSMFWNNLTMKTKHMRMVPDAEHSLAGHTTQVSLNVGAWARTVAAGDALPNFTWSVNASTQEIAVTPGSGTTFERVSLWWAFTPPKTGRRDFRLLVGHSAADIQYVPWWPVLLTPDADGVYRGTHPLPPETDRWLGMFVEVEWVSPRTGQPIIFTTEAQIFPEQLPFPPCGVSCDGPGE